MSDYVYLDANQVPPYLRGTYLGKSFKARAVTELHINGQAGVWDHGSRETYHAVRLADGKQLPLIDHNAAPWDMAARKDIVAKVEPGIAIVRHSMYCGKDMGLTFYIHPDNITAMLPKPVELTTEEKQVLYVTRSLISRARKEELERNRFPMAQYDSVIASLIAKGLLAPNKAITTKGRNAAESLNYTVFPSRF